MSTTTTKGESSTATTPAPKKELPQLQALEDDDEFEEFAAENWEEEETYGAEIEKRSTVEGKSKSGLDSLWEDSWDDDGIEDDFSLQLRGELQKQSTAMQL